MFISLLFCCGQHTLTEFFTHVSNIVQNSKFPFVLNLHDVQFVCFPIVYGLRHMSCCIYLIQHQRTHTFTVEVYIMHKNNINHLEKFKVFFSRITGNHGNNNFNGEHIILGYISKTNIQQWHRNSISKVNGHAGFAIKFAI